MIPLIVLQARFASTRLPGKALAEIDGRSVLSRCLARLRMSRAGKVILATTVNPEDDTLAAVAIAAGIPVFRGSERDVLLRTLQAARQMGASHVVRATADNPAVDADAARRTLDVLLSSGADYVVEYGLPIGAAVEAMTTIALAKADALAVRDDDREHVTLMMKRDRLFHAIAVPAPAVLCRPDLRFTIDTLEDLAYMRAVLPRAGATGAVEPPLADIIGAAEALAPGLDATQPIAVGQ